jgi:hypothetical protein
VCHPTRINYHQTLTSPIKLSPNLTLQISINPNYHQNPNFIIKSQLSTKNMSSIPEIIDLTSSSSSSSSDGWSDYFPPGVHPKKNPDVKPPSPSPSEDLANIPSDLDDSDAERELEIRWNALDIGEPNHAPIPAERQYVSPFVFTSDEESSEVEDEDPSFIPPSTPERSQPRPRKSNPSIPTSRDVVIGLPAPGSGASYHGRRGKGKEAEVMGKGKGKVE